MTWWTPASAPPAADAQGTTDVPVVVVGNKCDLEDAREVPREEGEAFAARAHADFFEVSALEGRGLGDVFEAAVRRYDASVPPKAASDVPSRCVLL